MSTISFVGSAGYTATSGTVPTHVIGDLIVITAYRTATTAPALGSGYTAVDNTSGNTNSIRVGYKWATSTTDASGTWTNATGILINVYRGVAGIGVVDATTHAAATTVSLASLAAFTNPNGESYVVAAYGSTAASTGVPTGFTSRSTQASTGYNIQLADKANSSSFSATTCTNASSTVSASVTFELLQTDSISTLVDSFQGSSLNSALWSSSVAGSGTLSYSSAGVVAALPSAATSSSLAQVDSNYYYDLTGAAVYLNVTGITSAATAADNTFDLVDTTGNNAMILQVEAGTLYAEKVVGGTETNITSVTYNGTTMAWWRLRESSGTVYWEYAASPTGTWTTLTSATNPWASNVIHAMVVHIFSSAYENETNPGSMSWVNFNTTPSTVPTNLFFF